MSRTVRARLDARAEENLALLRNEGHNESAAIRLALREAADRRRAKSALRVEAAAAAADPDDLAEARRVREDMDALRAHDEASPYEGSSSARLIRQGRARR